jgi:hypothetical protein
MSSCLLGARASTRQAIQPNAAPNSRTPASRSGTINNLGGKYLHSPGTSIGGQIATVIKDSFSSRASSPVALHVSVGHREIWTLASEPIVPSYILFAANWRRPFRKGGAVMMTLTIVSIVVGAIFAYRFSFCALAPAILFGTATAVIIARGDSTSSIVLSCIVVATGVQLGYLAAVIVASRCDSSRQLSQFAKTGVAAIHRTTSAKPNRTPRGHQVGDSTSAAAPNSVTAPRGKTSGGKVFINKRMPIGSPNQWMVGDSSSVVTVATRCGFRQRNDQSESKRFL